MRLPKCVLAIVLILVPIIGIYFYQNSIQTVGWDTITNDDFGIHFKYPTSITVKALGPNSSQQQLDNGEQISGTVSPSFETYEFSEKEKGLLYLEIFHENDTLLTVEGWNSHGYLYLYGKCDTRWLNTKPEPVGAININTIQVLDVKVEGADYAECYYLKNKRGNLVVLSTSVFDNKSDFNRAKEMANKVLSTVKTY
jgi:hypothetical protein